MAVLPLLAGLLAGQLPAAALAHYFGSNTAGYQTAAHACDTSINSQCVANNGVHVVYVCCSGDSTYQPTIDALSFIDAQVVDVVTSITTSTSSADVQTYQGNYGDTSWWAYGNCYGDYSQGGSDPDMWCRPQAIHYNIGHPTDWDGTVTGRRVVACHELGHTLGLRHYGDATCMRSGAYGSSYYHLNSDQISHLNGQY